uniref:Uncharacterized protein n=1 Tax=Panagrolaimus sp. JU765 TaxID=591449 RepID=A0AC34RG60_9BILA
MCSYQEILICGRRSHFDVWHCADENLLNVTKEILTEYHTTDTVSAALANFLTNYTTRDWSIFSINFTRNRAEWTPSSNDNPNLCYIARLDINILVILARVYKE